MDNPKQVKEIESIITFWTNAGADKWFKKDKNFDDLFRNSFLNYHFLAAEQKLENWNNTSYGALALQLLLDQFPRNSFRNTAHMFATDYLARYYSKQAITKGFIEELPDELKIFLYITFMHSENIEDQTTCLKLCKKYSPYNVSFAQDHYNIIKEFSRFPHRNKILLRDTTAAEQKFLEDGGFAG